MNPSARTLAQVAAAAGVSRMTVSRVLRHPEKVSPATRERVLACIDALSYRPNPLVSTLMAATRQRRASDTSAGIAYLISYPKETLESYEVSEGIYQGARERALRKGYEMIPHSLSDERLPIGRLGEIFKARGVEGIIFGPMMHEHARLPIDLRGLAAAACGHTLHEPAVHRVAINQRALAAQAYLTARARRYERIGLVITDNARLGALWLSAIQETRGADEPPLWVYRSDRKRPEGLLRWLRRTRPDCIISDTADALVSLKDAGYVVPENVGFILLGHFRRQPLLSGFAKSYEAVGAAAVDLITLQLQDNERGIPEHRKTVLLDPQWNEGTTVRPSDGSPPPAPPPAVVM